MIKSIGTDIVNINRINYTDSFINKILHPAEIKSLASFTDMDRKKHFLAGRWAAKESIFKACHSWSIGKYIDWNIFLDQDKQVLQIRGINLPPGYVLHISISHCTDYATAVVILEKVCKNA